MPGTSRWDRARSWAWARTPRPSSPTTGPSRRCSSHRSVASRRGSRRAASLFYYVLLGLLALTVLSSWAIRRSRFGIGLLAIRDDEEKAAGLGINTPRHKLVAFVASSVPIGVGGGIYGYYLSFLDPRAM